MKKIVTHFNPDLDALTSVWLLRRFLLGWAKAEISFCAAGKTHDGQPADSDPEVLHVDTGLGQLDHHQSNKITSAAELTWQYILTKRKKEPLSRLDQEAVERIVAVVTEFDNARDLLWPEAKEDRYEFYLHELIYGIKRNIPEDGRLMAQGLILLDGLLRVFKDKIKAEEKIEHEGQRFKTRWGKAIALETGNEKVLWEAEVKGFILVVKYDPEMAHRVKIYSHFKSKVDLTGVYETFRKIDSQADWFLHASKKLLLISSAPQARGTKLSLAKIIATLENA